MPMLICTAAWSLAVISRRVQELREARRERGGCAAQIEAQGWQRTRCATGSGRGHPLRRAGARPTATLARSRACRRRRRSDRRARRLPAPSSDEAHHLRGMYRSTFCPASFCILADAEGRATATAAAARRARAGLRRARGARIPVCTLAWTPTRICILSPCCGSPIPIAFAPVRWHRGRARDPVHAPAYLRRCQRRRRWLAIDCTTGDRATASPTPRPCFDPS